MRGELPRVRHLVEDQPAPQVLTGQLGLAAPLLDVGLDQVQAVGAHRFGAKKLRVVLAEHAPAEKCEQECDVVVQPRPAGFDDQRVGQPPLLEDRINHPAQDVEVQVEPARAVEGRELGQRRGLRHGADELEQRALQLRGHQAVLVLRRRQVDRRRR